MLKIFIIREMQIATVLKYHYTPSKMANKQIKQPQKNTPDNSSCWQGTEQLELSCIAGENQK